MKKVQQVKISTKEDIQSLKLDIQELKEKTDDNQKTLEGKLDRISITLDGFVGRVDDLTIENQVGANQIKELRDKANDHEERITKLESPQSP